jgi:hypothetical protein
MEAVKGSFALSPGSLGGPERWYSAAAVVFGLFPNLPLRPLFIISLL